MGSDVVFNRISREAPIGLSFLFYAWNTRPPKAIGQCSTNLPETASNPSRSTEKTMLFVFNRGHGIIGNHQRPRLARSRRGNEKHKRFPRIGKRRQRVPGRLPAKREKRISCSWTDSRKKSKGNGRRRRQQLRVSNIWERRVRVRGRRGGDSR